MEAWGSMQLEFDVAPTTGPLAQHVWLAGDSRDGRLQRALTHQLARHRHLRVHAGMLARPVECRMRQSWLRSDRFSQQWVRRYPCGEFVMEALEFRAGVCLNLGLPVGALLSLVGLPIPCRQRAAPRRCDEYGEQAALACLPGAHWDIEHDFFARVVTSSVYGAGIRGEDTPRDLFISCGLPLRVVLDPQPGADLPARRHGIVPDAILRDMPLPRGMPARWVGARQLLEFKMLHGGGCEDYRQTRGQTSRRDGGGVGRRAAAVQGEYEQHARRLDERFIEPAARRVRSRDVLAGRVPAGPVLERLREFPPIRACVAGAYSEMSHDLHVLASQTADAGAERAWRHMGCQSQTEARSHLISRIRSEWGMAAFMSAARLLVWRLHEIGLTVAESMAGRQHVQRARAAGPTPWDVQRAEWAYTDAFLQRVQLGGAAHQAAGDGL